MNRILSVTILTATFALAGQGMAQSQMSGPNGVAASPRVAKAMNERPVSQPAAVANRVAATTPAVAASPRIQSQLNERPKSGLANPGSTVASSTTRSGKPIAASPKLQEQMNAQPMQFQIAPLK